jgi:hypothetical protein
MLGFSFIVFSKAAVTSEPGEGALDHPAFGQDFETGIDAFEHGSPSANNLVTRSSPAGARARHREAIRRLEPSSNARAPAHLSSEATLASFVLAIRMPGKCRKTLVLQAEIAHSSRFATRATPVLSESCSGFSSLKSSLSRSLKPPN